MRFDKLAGVALLSTFLTMVACGAPAVGEGTGTTAAKETGSSDNDKTAFDFFLGKGFSATQAAAIVGNLDQESGMDPTIKQGGGGPGRGIAQWSLNDRWATENSFASQNGEDENALQTQLDFIMQEFSTNAAFGLADLQGATDLSSAVEIFQDKFEICGKCNAGSRVTFAQRALDAFSGDAPAATADSAPAAGDDDTTNPTSTNTNTTASNTTGTDTGGTFDPNTGTFTPSTGTNTSGSSASASGDDDDSAVGTGCMINDGEEGECMATSDCSAQGGTSTAGYCSGAASVQCCTFGASAGDDDDGYAHSARRK